MVSNMKMNIYRGKNKNQICLASLLYDAIEDADLRSVKMLLEKSADPNLVLPKKTISPFHVIIGNDSEKFALEVTSLVLQYGGNPNVMSDDGLTPLHIAAAWGRREILELLLKSGGDPEVRDSNNKTPLEYAAEENCIDCYNLLQEYVPENMNKEEQKSYNFELDKVLVNNGITIGEYEIVNEYKAKNGTSLERLTDLSESHNKEYVLNWVNSQNGTNLTQSFNKLPSSTRAFSTDFSHSDDSLKESDVDMSKRLETTNIRFRKVYRKKMKNSTKAKTPAITIDNSTNHTSDFLRFSKESGITTLDSTSSKLNSANQSSIMYNNTIPKKDNSSDYMTCTSEGSHLNVLEMNVYEVSDDSLTNNQTHITINSDSSQAKSEGISSSDLSFVSVSEIYKYVDQDEGIVLYERNLLKSPVRDCGTSIVSINSGRLSSLPETINYDTDTMRNELNNFGYVPGPITVTTKRIYLKKLKQLRRNPTMCPPPENTRVYSVELQKTLRNPDWVQDLSHKKSLDDAILAQFATPDPSKRWREGITKSSFTYLLMDPRITNNLPSRSESLELKDIWEIFLSAVFYVGKGKRSRPYSHLYEAVQLWNDGLRSSKNKKLDRILNIWNDNGGVVCLHIFQNTIPVEAYTREAAIINALKIDNLCNCVGGNFYGIAATWSQKEKETLGVYLLYKAMRIFLNEGERQLCPSDID